MSQEWKKKMCKFVARQAGSGQKLFNQLEKIYLDLQSRMADKTGEPILVVMGKKEKMTSDGSMIGHSDMSAMTHTLQLGIMTDDEIVFDCDGESPSDRWPIEKYAEYMSPFYADKIDIRDEYFGGFIISCIAASMHPDFTFGPTMDSFEIFIGYDEIDDMFENQNKKMELDAWRLDPNEYYLMAREIGIDVGARDLVRDALSKKKEQILKNLEEQIRERDRVASKEVKEIRRLLIETKTYNIGSPLITGLSTEYSVLRQ